VLSLPWALTFASTLLWAGFDAQRKALAARLSVPALSFWLSAVQLPGYALWALLEGELRLSLDYFPPALASIFLNIFANLAFLEAVRIAPLSQTVPLLSFTPVFVAVAGVPLLGEALAPGQLGGVLLITLGALSLAASPGEGGLRAVLVFFRSRGVRLMLWVALFWALTPVCDKMALAHASVGVHGFLLSLGIALGMGFYFVSTGSLPELRVPRPVLPLLLLGGVSNVLALGSQFLALRLLYVSLFEAAKRALGLLLSLVLGRLWFGEELNARKLVSGALMSLGVVFLLGLL